MNSPENPPNLHKLNYSQTILFIAILFPLKYGKVQSNHPIYELKTVLMFQTTKNNNYKETN